MRYGLGPTRAADHKCRRILYRVPYDSRACDEFEVVFCVKRETLRLTPLRAARLQRVAVLRRPSRALYGVEVRSPNPAACSDPNRDWELPLARSDR